jgi:hypothetical protein
VKLSRTASVALVVLFWGCGGEAAQKCNHDLGTSWASSSCKAAVQDSSNQALVGALGEEACARAKLGTSDVAVADAACGQARAQSEKAAWLEIERSASPGTQPRLVLDDLLPGLPKAPPPQVASVNPYAQQLFIEQQKSELLERQIRKQQRQLKQQKAKLRAEHSSHTNKHFEDDCGQIVDACGQPDTDDSTLHASPPPLLVTRWLDYQRAGVRFIFLLSSGRVGSEPRAPYSWTIMGATYGEDQKKSSVRAKKRSIGFRRNVLKPTSESCVLKGNGRNK